MKNIRRTRYKQSAGAVWVFPAESNATKSRTGKARRERERTRTAASVEPWRQAERGGASAAVGSMNLDLLQASLGLPPAMCPKASDKRQAMDDLCARSEKTARVDVAEGACSLKDMRMGMRLGEASARPLTQASAQASAQCSAQSSAHALAGAEERLLQDLRGHMEKLEALCCSVESSAAGEQACSRSKHLKMLKAMGEKFTTTILEIEDEFKKKMRALQHDLRKRGSTERESSMCEEEAEEDSECGSEGESDSEEDSSEEEEEGGGE